MHRPRKGFMGILQAPHPGAIHQFFTDAEPTFDENRDFRIVFFPPYAMVAFIAISIPAAAALYALASQCRLAAYDHQRRALSQLRAVIIGRHI